VESGIRVFGRLLRFSQPGQEGGPHALSVRPGELAYLKAGSGIGKTTVAKIVIGLQKADYFRLESTESGSGCLTPPVLAQAPVGKENDDGIPACG